MKGSPACCRYTLPALPTLKKGKLPGHFFSFQDQKCSSLVVILFSHSLTHFTLRLSQLFVKKISNQMFNRCIITSRSVTRLRGSLIKCASCEGRSLSSSMAAVNSEIHSFPEVCTHQLLSRISYYWLTEMFLTVMYVVTFLTCCFLYDTVQARFGARMERRIQACLA